MKKLRLIVLASILLISTGFLSAGSSADLNGTWKGWAENQGSMDSMTLVLEKTDSGYSGKLTDEMGMFYESEVKNIKIVEDVVTFEFEGSMDTSYFTVKVEVKLAEGTMKGSWTVDSLGAAGSCEFTKEK